MRWMFWLMGMLVIFGFPADTKSSEIKTICPAFKPDEPNVLFHRGEPYPQGYPTVIEEDRKTKKGVFIYFEFDFTDYNSAKGVLMCEFKDRSQIEIPLPGLLLRCGMVTRDIPNKPLEWLDVWCISDDERMPASKKK